MVNVILFSIFIGMIIGAVIVIDISAIVAAGENEKRKLESSDLTEWEESK